MKKTLLILSIFSAGAVFSQAPAFAWARASASIGDPKVSTTGGVVVDTVNQFVYATGSFDGGNINFGSGDLDGTSALSVYVTKYNLSGSLIWAKSFPSGDDNTATGIGVDNAGNIYVTGYSQNDTVRFGSLFILNSDPGSTDHTVAYVVKMDASGSPQWLKGSTGGGGVISNGIAVDAAGNSYITGHVFNNTGSFLGNTMTEGAFFMKLSTTGTSTWFKQTSPAGPLISQGTCIALDKAGDCVVSGTYVSNLNFDNLSITYTGGSGTTDRFTTKLSGSTGAFTWAVGAGIWQGPDYPYGIATDSQNNVFLSGYLSAATQGTGSSSYQSRQFVEKLNSSGTSQWLNTYRSSFVSVGSAIVTDKSGNAYATFNVTDTTVYGNYTITPTGFFTFVIGIIKFDPSGTVQYVKASTEPQGSSFSFPISLAKDASNNVYLTASINNSCSFDSFNFNPTNTEFAIAKLGGPVVVSGIQENTTAASALFAYPSPAAGTIYIHNLKAKSAIKISDVSGKLVLSSGVSASNNSVDVSSLQSGVYFIEVMSEGSSMRQKIIVNNN